MRAAGWIASGLMALLLALVAFDLHLPHATAPVVVRLAPGTSRWQIACRLSAAGVLRDPISFQLWALAHPHARPEAGIYRFSGRLTPPAVFDQIRRGAVAGTVFAVPEGYNRFDIAHALQRQGLADEAAFVSASANPALVRDLDPDAITLEGYLFPGTYRIPPDATADAIAAMMVARFRQAGVALAAAGWPPRMGPRTAAQGAQIHAWVIVASLVEKETALPAERAVIAGVFYHRLALGLPLQCDPTVIYAALLAGAYTGTIHRVDLQRPSPYNTYVNRGLPPGPITNPGLAALRAALQPATTPYLYFVSDGAGGHRFATTLAQQRQNVRLYENSRAQRVRAATGH